MTKARMALTGVTAVDKALKEFEPRVQKQIARKAMRKASKPVLKAIVAKSHFDKGRYKRIIKIKALKRSRARNARYRIGVKITTDRKALNKWVERERAERNDPKWYFNPHWLEYGNKDQKAQPHFRPVMDSYAGRVLYLFRAELPAIIEETAAKLRNKG